MKNFSYKKSFFILIIILLNFLLLELICSFILKKIEHRHSNKFNLEFNSENIKKKLIGEIYSKKIPYLRDKNQYDGSAYISLKNERDFIFNEINEFSNQNKLNILIQGDSLGESLNMKNINYKYSKYFKNKKIGVANSAVSSYAIIPHYFQLDMLLNEFDLNPNIQITIYDQTDIGDDLYRYNVFLNNKHYEKYKFYDTKLMNSFSQKNLNSFKMILLAQNYFLREKSRFMLTNYQTFKKILRRIYLKNFKKLPVSLEPLVYGISKSENEKLTKLVSKYIDMAFSNNNLKNLYFVVQPTTKHVDKLYVMDNRNILLSAINNHKFKERIKIISFFDNDKSFYSFVKGDIFSHPTNSYYIKKFWPKIFNEVLSHQKIKLN